MIALSRSRVRTAETTRRRILADTERESEALRREAQVEAREQVGEASERDRGRGTGQAAPDREDRGAHPAEGRGDRREAHRPRAPRAGPRRSRGACEGAAGRAQAGQGRGAGRAPAALGPHRARGEAAAPRAVQGPRASRARARSAADGRGGARRCPTTCAGTRRRLTPAGRGESHGRGHRDGRRARVRRPQGADHRPGRTEHPRARASHRRRLHHRRHPACGGALVVRSVATRGRPSDARQADRRRADPPGADRGDVLPLEGRARGARSPGRRAGRVRGELRRAARGAGQDPRPPAVSHELRAERPQSTPSRSCTSAGSWLRSSRPG